MFGFGKSKKEEQEALSLFIKYSTDASGKYLVMRSLGKHLIGSKPPTNLVTKYGKLRNMIQKTQISCDKNTTRWNLNLCIPFFVRISEVSTIEWD